MKRASVREQKHQRKKRRHSSILPAGRPDLYNVRMRSIVSFTILVTLCLIGSTSSAQLPVGTYQNSLIMAPIYVQYLDVTDDQFAREAQDFKARIPSAPYVKVGFGAFFTPQLVDAPLTQPITEADLSADLAKIDTIVDRAKANAMITHLALVSGFFHGQNALRWSAIRQDVRNAQWFADGLISDPSQTNNPDALQTAAWITPSRYAQPLRSRVEEAFRILAQRIASRMQRNPETLVTVSGDGETELTFERNFADAGTKPGQNNSIIYTDYSPFMVAEFRDWLRHTRYDGDLAPNTDDNHDGHTFDQDFAQAFTTWNLRYFNESGPIPYAQWVALPEKLPNSGPYATPGGFDAPRVPKTGDAFWDAWIQFRKTAIKDWVTDFATWITTTPDPTAGFTVPASRFYTHQIPADFIFGKSDDPRLKTSASYVETAIINPIASSGVTAFNGYDGKKHFKTATPALFSSLFMTSDNWGVLEYNPSVPYSNTIPASSDPQYYAAELRMLWGFRPHLIVPVLWSDNPAHKNLSIKGTVYERALRDFVRDVGRTPWYSWRRTAQ